MMAQLGLKTPPTPGIKPTPHSVVQVQSNTPQCSSTHYHSTILKLFQLYYSPIMYWTYCKQRESLLYVNSYSFYSLLLSNFRLMSNFLFLQSGFSIEYKKKLPGIIVCRLYLRKWKKKISWRQDMNPAFRAPDLIQVLTRQNYFLSIVNNNV